jgi:glycosyltransferase involved in cell wall biosynthesis
MKITAVVITLNEAARIGRCLESVRWCDEMVVVDSGSTDATIEIARAAGARVASQAWQGYGPQKAHAVRLARNDWVLCIDADEIVSPQLRAGIESALAKPEFKAYEFARCNRFMGRYLRHGEGYPDWVLRLFDRRHAEWSRDAVHENVQTAEKVGRIRGDLLHDSAQTLHAYLEKQNAYTTLQAQALFERGQRPSLPKLVLSPPIRFLKFYALRLGFLDGVPGLVHILIGCFNTFSKNAKLLALWAGR